MYITLCGFLINHLGKIVGSAFISMNNSGELILATLSDLTPANAKGPNDATVGIGMRLIGRTREIPDKI
jgi:hypothetical protein